MAQDSRSLLIYSSFSDAFADNSARQKATRSLKLSVIIPFYNEEKTLKTCVDRVLSIQNETLELELILVDDCSNDKSSEIARSIVERIPSIVLLRHEVNKGKGAAVRTGIAHVTGDFVAIQDSDLEYDPKDLEKLLTPTGLGSTGSRLRWPFRKRWSAVLWLR